jgi:hypothetical protein
MTGIVHQQNLRALRRIIIAAVGDRRRDWLKVLLAKGENAAAGVAAVIFAPA